MCLWNYEDVPFHAFPEGFHWNIRCAAGELGCSVLRRDTCGTDPSQSSEREWSNLRACSPDCLPWGCLLPKPISLGRGSSARPHPGRGTREFRFLWDQGWGAPQCSAAPLAWESLELLQLFHRVSWRGMSYLPCHYIPNCAMLSAEAVCPQLGCWPHQAETAPSL